MSQQGRRRSTMDMGHDAFLDIVANLVGILIILVVVLGTQTQRVTDLLVDAPEDPIEMVELDSGPSPLSNPPTNPPTNKYASDGQLEQLKQIAIQAATAQRESFRLEANLKQYDQQIEQLRNARGQLLDMITLAEEAWEEKQTELDKTKVLSAKRQREIREAESQIAELAGTKDQLANQEAPLVAVEHLPTPMAKTVFGDEIDFRLKNGRLSVIPVEPLMKAVREDAQRLLTREGNATSSVGPLRDYIANFVIERQVGRSNRNGQMVMTMAGRIGAIAFEPLNESVGQPIEQILGSSSFLDIELAGRDPAETTITVWVFEDSFAELRRLKEHLYARGFATAARPLMDGQAIIFSSRGTKSKAQ